MTPGRAGPGWSERFWTALLLPAGGGPEVVKWIDFGRRLVLAVGFLVLALGSGLTLVSAVQTGRLLEEGLRAQARSIAGAAARVAFVPLSLEDRRSLESLAGEFSAARDLASLRVVDSGGRVRARRDHPLSGGRIAASAPVRGPEGGPDVGRVEVEMSTGDSQRRRRALFGTSLVLNGLLSAGVLSVGFVLIRNLTRRMLELVDEARLIAELRRSNRELEEFAYVASHDLQSPLRKVSGFAELLKESCAGRLPPEGEEYVDLIVKATRRMQSLIEDLLTYSRVGSRQLECGPVDIDAVLREVVSDLEPAIAEARAVVEAGPMPTLTADRRQMGQLFQNLIANALKFRAERPCRVRVRAERTGDVWAFSVSDNGIGMEAQYLGQIFKMFRRLHPVSAYSGTGIGLAVCRKIVERHGGTISVESRPGEGSTFRFTLGRATRGDAPDGRDDER